MQGRDMNAEGCTRQGCSADPPLRYWHARWASLGWCPECTRWAPRYRLPSLSVIPPRSKAQASRPAPSAIFSRVSVTVAQAARFACVLPRPGPSPEILPSPPGARFTVPSQGRGHRPFPEGEVALHSATVGFAGEVPTGVCPSARARPRTGSSPAAVIIEPAVPTLPEAGTVALGFGAFVPS